MYVALNRNRGFTLLETLIAVIVLAIGLLGLAGLQAVALRTNTASLQRSQVSDLAYDMIDRMRVNRTEAAQDAGPYEVVLGAALPTLPQSEQCMTLTVGGVDIVDGRTSCTSAQMAAFDLHQWREQLQVQFPGIEACIDAQADGTVEVGLRWSEIAADSAGGTYLAGSALTLCGVADACTNATCFRFLSQL